MSLNNSNSHWLRRGRQRAAVARVLRKPMTTLEICETARVWAPRLQLRDVWFLMRQMANKGLVLSLNQRANNGRLYVLTDDGRGAVEEAFGIKLAKAPSGVDWRLYSWVIRARIRRRVLTAFMQMRAKGLGQTATNVYKHLRGDYPVGLNPVIRAVHELASKNLISCVGATKLRTNKLYQITPAGALLAAQLTL